MTQEQMELSEAIDQEIHILGKHRLMDLEENDMVEHLMYLVNQIIRLFRLIIKEKIGETRWNRT